MAEKIILKNGTIALPGMLLGQGEVNYATEYSEHNTAFPIERDILQFSGTATGAQLALGKNIIEKAIAPYSGNEYVRVYDDFSNAAICAYNKDTDEITFSDESMRDKIFDYDIIMENHWEEMVTKFVLYVVMCRNPFVYCLFTEYTPKTKRFISGLYGRRAMRATLNVWKHIDALVNFEKIAKSIGEDFIFDNICEENFSLNNAKKLSQVVEMPMQVAQGIQKLKVEETFGDFRTVAGVDKNYAITLMDFILNFRKAFPGKDYCAKADIIKFVSHVAKLMSTGVYNSNFTDLLNFLLNESINYGKFCLPVRESGELNDYIQIAMGMREYDSTVKFEKFPRNIQKAHNVIQQNNMIISRPRPEEFAAAVAKQAFLNDEKDEEYVFMVPRNEMDLLNEGNVLHHCVASYRDRIIDMGTQVVLMRKKDDPETPFVTIEYEHGMAVQIRTMFNLDVEDADVLAAVNRYLARAERRELKK